MEQTGVEGEELAAQHLAANGYRILERNWRVGHREVDIIAEKDGLLVIVEVKTQQNRRFGDPEFRVNRVKQQHLIQAANSYVLKKRIDKEVRFDIIAVIINQAGEELHHIENAFHPSW